MFTPTSPNFERERFLFVLSEAHNKAVLLEKEAKCPRMLADNTLTVYLNQIAYEHKDRFFYRDGCGGYCFDWYGGLMSIPDDKRAQILSEIRDAVTLNAMNNGGNKEVLSKLVHFGTYHNNKVTESPLNCPEFTIDLARIESLLM